MSSIKHLHASFDIPEGGQAMRLDHFLSIKLPNKSRNVIQKHIKMQMVLVNDKKSKASYQLKPFDKVEWFESFRKLEELIPYDYPLDILEENDAFIVINKPANMSMHPGLGVYKETLQNALQHHYNVTNQPTALIKDCLVQRLDKDTSGIVVIPKTVQAREHLGAQFQGKSTNRVYHAIVWGTPDPQKGMIKKHIGRNPDDKMSIEVSDDGVFGKEAITHYSTIASYPQFSIVECILETGRTHQIRVHMQYIDHPLVGDKRYEKVQYTANTTLQNSIGRHCLHARLLHFDHPQTLERMKYELGLPDDLKEIIEKYVK
ncbi:RluA family pseudouridine synthase [Flammeovirga pacifica]|uniref:Pseudouridine synthase n=1 Tax=Flammeovirga pacifica TaxID=915059 RepID=A0A1S1Z4F7_FLAPC|nr:RluA family pseudouridine synthase [Flammeovirga pacifica]OHX68121.1 hypothetical protein NH26_18110 [Flammeovirga pacifica]